MFYKKVIMNLCMLATALQLQRISLSPSPTSVLTFHLPPGSAPASAGAEAVTEAAAAVRERQQQGQEQESNRIRIVVASVCESSWKTSPFLVFIHPTGSFFHSAGMRFHLTFYLLPYNIEESLEA